MEERQSTRSRPGFSPWIAIVASLPVFIVAGALFGPALWDVVAGFVHWKGPNAARVVREWCVEDGGILSVYIVALVLCPKAARYCFETVGFESVRKTLFSVNFLGAILLYGGGIGFIVRGVMRLL
jgi:hypothetical protein